MADQFHTAKKDKSGFVSLHRKWLTSLSLLLVVICVVFGGMNFWYLKEQVKTQQAASQAAWRAEFKGLIEHSVDRLQRLSIVLASLGRLSEHLDKPGSSINSAEFQEQFSSVRYELDVERIMVFDKAGNIRWNWSPDSGSPLTIKAMIDAVLRMQNNEHPTAELNCQSPCALNIVMPLLADGKHVGFIGLSQRISDLVLEFSTATGVDVGILVPSRNVTQKTFPHWRLDTAALTHAKALKPLIAYLSEKYASPMDIPSDVGLPWKGEFFVVNTLALNDIIKDANGYVVFISNASNVVSALKQSTQNSLLLMVFSLFLAEIFLLLFLRNPLLRISHLAATLPLVAQGNYQDAYKRLNNKKRLKMRTHDEIDTLYESSIDLTRQIQRSQLKLAADRDFIQGILDSAQVMILTQSHEGAIHTVNRYMAQLLGRSPENLKGRLFVDIIENGEGKDRYKSNRPRLFSSSLHRFEHEASIIDGKGEQRHIIWIHTYLGQANNDDNHAINVLSVGMDATDRIVAENHSRWLAHHDPLTGLANRLRFHEELERSFAYSVRSNIASALLLLDLDYFKTVNDTSGHAAGDALLKVLADELRLRARKSDLVARLGGDEFAVLLPATGQAGAEVFANSLIERLSAHRFQFGGQEYRISISMGIALMPAHGENVGELIINADTAMYEAKKAGRGCWRCFSPLAEADCPAEQARIL